MDIDQISDWIALAYEGVIDQERWIELLGLVTPAIGAHVAQLDVSHPRQTGGSVVLTAGIPPSTISAWEDRHALNPWVRGAMRLAPGQVACGSDLIEPSAIRRTEYFVDIMAPLDLEESIGTVLYRSEEVQAHLSICGSNFFDAEQQRIFSLVASHLRNSVALHRQMKVWELKAAGFQDTLDRLPFGVGMLDRTGRLVHANRFLAQLIREGDGLKVDRQILQCTNSRDNRKFAQRIGAALATSAGQSFQGGGLVAVSRPEPRPPIQLLVGPLSQGRTDLLFIGESHPIPSIFIIATDPEYNPGVDRHALRDLFNLTKSESELVDSLIRGESVSDYANQVGIGIGTARWRMKRVLEKTNTHRQGELIAFMAKNLVAFAPENVPARKKSRS